MGSNNFSEHGKNHWLVYHNKKELIKFLFPPFKGDHAYCFKQINYYDGPKLIPAEGLDLALLIQGAYNPSTENWAKLKEEYLDKFRVRLPLRITIRKRNKKGRPDNRNGLVGLIVEKDETGGTRRMERGFQIYLAGKIKMEFMSVKMKKWYLFLKKNIKKEAL